MHVVIRKAPVAEYNDYPTTKNTTHTKLSYWIRGIFLRDLRELRGENFPTGAFQI